MKQAFRHAALKSAAASLLFVSASAYAIDPTAITAKPPVDVSAAAPAPASTSAAAPVAAAAPSGNNGFLSGVLGCSAEGNKQTIGAVAGGVLGGVLGNRIAGRHSRTLGTLLGGVLGAAAGSWLGCKLQRTDQEKAQRALENAVSTGSDQTWSSPETGASGKVQTVSAPNLTDIRFASGVDPAEAFTKVSGAYVATTIANVRSTPGTTGTILSQLQPGQRVWVPASVQGKPWMLISEDGVAKGYVAQSLLKQESTAAASNCKLVKQTISVPGGQDESETLQACKDSSGQWVMTRV